MSSTETDSKKTKKTPAATVAPAEEKPFKTLYEKSEDVPQEFQLITVIQVEGKDHELFYNPAEKVPSKAYIKRALA